MKILHSNINKENERSKREPWSLKIPTIYGDSRDAVCPLQNNIRWDSIELVYSPTSHRSLIESIINRYNGTDKQIIPIGFDDENTAIDYVNNQLAQRRAECEEMSNNECHSPVWAYVKFESIGNEDRVTIRMPTFETNEMKCFDGSWHTAPLKQNQPKKIVAIDMYDNNHAGFISFQHCIAAVLSGTALPITTVAMPLPMRLRAVNLNNQPYQRFKRSTDSTNKLSDAEAIQVLEDFVFELIIPIFTILVFAISIQYITKQIITERANHLIEYMKVMGLHGFVYYMSHFTIAIIKLTIVMFLASFIICVFAVPGGDAIAGESSFILIFIFFFFYAIGMIWFCFAISTLLSPEKHATLLTFLFWHILIIPYFVWADHKSRILRGMTGLALNSNMGNGFRLIGRLERDGGLGFSNMLKRPDAGDLNFIEILLIFLIDAIIYAIFTWYVSSVFPGGDAVRESYIFFLKISYWRSVFGISTTNEIDIENALNKSKRSQSAVVEPNDPSKAHISIDGLSKEFGRGKSKFVAVNKISFNMNRNQLTALLGHNGAGKSTTVQMLTGMIKPSSGDAIIGKWRLSKNLGEIRQHMGVCLQYNALFDRLTLMEHLNFFASLKGVQPNEVENVSLLYRMRLLHKENDYAYTLSGGQKRKLSIAIALVGASEMVVLDEPTAGIDSEARRDIWDILQIERRQRQCILLTTHYMEEADLLSDRIVIMSHGRVQCDGTPMFLKNKYGAGYRLNVNFVDEDSRQINESRILNILHESSASSELLSGSKKDSVYVLPTVDRARFPTIFKALEEAQTEMKIDAFGVSITTLEEVFLKVCDLAERNYAGDDYVQKEDIDPITFTSKVPLTGLMLWFTQLYAMLRKRFNYLLKSYISLIISTFIFILLIGLTLAGMVNSLPEKKNSNTRKTREVNGPITLSLKYQDNNNFVTKVMGAGPVYDAYKEDVDQLGEVESMYTSNPNDTTFWNELDESLAKDDGQNSVVDRYQIGAILSNKQPVAYFSSTGYHSEATSMAHIESAVHKGATGRNLVFVNHPLRISRRVSSNNHNYDSNGYDSQDYNSNSHYYRDYKYEQERKRRKRENEKDYEFAYIVVYAFVIVFCLATMAIWQPRFVAHEKQSKMKQLQIAAGTSPLAFWLAHLIYDTIIYMLFLLLVIIIMAALQITPMVATELAIGNILLNLLFVMATNTIVYALTCIFTNPRTVMTMSLIFIVLIGLIGLFIDDMAKLLTGEKNKGKKQEESIFQDVLFIIRIIMTVLSPVFNFGRGLTELFYACFEDLCSSYKCNIELNVNRPVFAFGWYSRNGIGNVLVALFIQFFIVFTLVVLIDYSIFRPFAQVLSRIIGCNMCRGNNQNIQLADQSAFQNGRSYVDVVDEANIIDNLASNDAEHYVIAKHLKKDYGFQQAVVDVSFRVRKGECFGLLGVNGAGKTSTFNMITGENSLTGGNAYIMGKSIKGICWQRATKHAGYCPQFDTYIGQLTCRNLLKLFARIRGVRGSDVKPCATSVLEATGLTTYATRKAGTLSGGCKRRLSLGLAFIGRPQIMLLDEPTTGVDPASRRALWNIMMKIKSTNEASIVLTSHNMEETEALCDNVTIMAAGKCRCFGAVQKLKEQLALGCSLIVKTLPNADTAKVRQAIEAAFIKSTFDEQHESMLFYTVEADHWSVLFDKAENLITSMDDQIEDYSLTQGSFEQVFITFAKQQ